MNDLFRFLLLRPANVTKSTDVKTLTPRFVEKGVPRSEAQRAARAYIAAHPLQRVAEELAYAEAALAVAEAVGGGSAKAKDIADIVKKVTAKTLAAVLDDPVFTADEARLADALAAMKLLSDSSGGDAPGLARLAQGYDAIRQAGGGRDPVSLRVLSIDDFLTPGSQPAPAGTAPVYTPPTGNVPVYTPTQGPDPREMINRLDDTISALGTLPASGFNVGTSAEGGQVPANLFRIDSRLAALEQQGGEVPQQVVVGAIDAPSPVGQPWTLASRTVLTLPDAVRNTVFESGLDLQTQPLPAVLEALHAQRTSQLMELEKASMPTESAIHMIGMSFGQVAANDYVGPPATGLPTGHGNIKPVGIGDLLLVKEHVLRYDGGDLAHVENVLKSEHLSRDTRRLERTETTIFQETETTKEEQRDTQTTDRFSLKRETSDTIKTEFSLKAGVAVDAKYGPMVEVKANADFATSTATESATKQATEFSKDVVARSVTKLVQRVLERRSTTTISEFEEKYSHGFDNTQGDANISGYYQWIDKVMQAQVYNYGKRLLFDATVPEPSTNFILTQTKNTDQGQNLIKPPPFTLTAAQINEGNYELWGAKYQVTGLEAPPPPVKTISKGYDASMPQDPHEATKSETLTIDDGYRAKYALFQRSWVGWDGRVWRILIGSNWIDALVTTGYFNMSGEIGSVAVAYQAYKMETLAATVEIFCERTDRAVVSWQLKVHSAITQGYQAKLQAYEQALAQAMAAVGTVIAGRNPGFNARLIAMELRKECLTLLTGQQFDGFGALELSAEGYAQPNLTATEKQMPYVRFFEQAFEWEHIIYFFYPFFWGWKPAWKKHMLLDDVDPQFGDFLRAGAARVVFPVRPGFEPAVIHYLETGEIWNGGPPPDISSSLYLPIVKEIQEATGAPGSEVPVGDPWLVHLPTTLVRLRPNNDLPTWHKVGEDWQPVN